MRKLLLGVAATVAFAMNPAFLGCGESELNFQFSAKEMNAAVAGSWQLTTKGTTHTFTLAQKTGDVQGRAGSSFFNEAAACSNRTLVASAHACMDTTTMPLIVTFADGSKHEATAELMVHGVEFTMGFLHLVIDDIDVMARIKPDGTVESDPREGRLVHTH